MSLVRLATASLCGIFLLPTSVCAQVPSHDCDADASIIVAELQKDRGEDVIAVALNSRGHLIRVLANPDTGGWSIVVEVPNGAGCLIHHGTMWAPVPAGAPS